MKIYMPWLGEFGSELLKWVPKIYSDSAEKSVVYEEGKEVLYPYDNVLVIPHVQEAFRECETARNKDEIYLKVEHHYGVEGNVFIYPCEFPKDAKNAKRLNAFPMKGYMFEPMLSETFNIECDVVLFPRWRHTAARKNWPHWTYLCQALQSEGIKVFACGHGDSSIHLPCPSAWDYEGQDLNASIYAIKHSKIRIGPMGALGVLSLMCGMKPWIITSERGYHTNRPQDYCNWAYYEFADHKKVGWKILPWLEEPERIIEEILIGLYRQGMTPIRPDKR